ncbi:MAG: c-type cytochrome [Planctomycetes bacterium]|nr:c-type cytochrome [Planctomycetota bacterium]
MNTRSLLNAVLLAIAALVLGACRGGTSSSPPVHLVLDMDFQPKVKAQSGSHLFHDGRGMRLPVDGTVARGAFVDQDLARFKDASGAFLTQNPVALTPELLARGKERFAIHCAICHGHSGRGGTGPTHAHGMVGRRWPAGVQIPSFHFREGADANTNRAAIYKDGELFDVITNGKGTMPAYGPRISVQDRWAIIHYIRALQTLGKQ